ncbi:hypothetical protein [Brasilonema sp. UFV-L1]
MLKSGFQILPGNVIQAALLRVTEAAALVMGIPSQRLGTRE